jgi:hypothetical protein
VLVVVELLPTHSAVIPPFKATTWQGLSAGHCETVIGVPSGPQKVMALEAEQKTVNGVQARATEFSGTGVARVKRGRNMSGASVRGCMLVCLMDDEGLWLSDACWLCYRYCWFEVEVDNIDVARCDDIPLQYTPSSTEHHFLHILKPENFQDSRLDIRTEPRRSSEGSTLHGPGYRSSAYHSASFAHANRANIFPSARSGT